MAGNCKVPLTEDNIEACHRTSTKDTALIIVKFKHRPKRNQLMEARKKLKDITKADLGFEPKDANDKGKILINESLTYRNKVLFRKARQKKVELNFEHAWNYKGKIFLRKKEDSNIIQINEEDLNKLKKFTFCRSIFTAQYFSYVYVLSLFCVLMNAFKTYHILNH